MYQQSQPKVKAIKISLLELKSCTQLLLEKGIDIRNGTTEKLPIVVVLDDAQAKYDDMMFWGYLIKSSPNWLSS